MTRYHRKKEDEEFHKQVCKYKLLSDPKQLKPSKTKETPSNKAMLMPIEKCKEEKTFHCKHDITHEIERENYVRCNLDSKCPNAGA